MDCSGVLEISEEEMKITDFEMGWKNTLQTNSLGDKK